MERKRAMAVAAGATATLGCAIVAGASLGGYALLGFGSAPDRGPQSLGPRVAAHQKSVTKYRDVYDKHVVDVAPVRAPASADRTVATTPTVDPTVPAPSSDDERETAPATLAPAPPPSAPSAPPTTSGERIEAPDDGRADTAVPPMPAHCHEPHLEDNGVWNCEGDD